MRWVRICLVHATQLGVRAWRVDWAEGLKLGLLAVVLGYDPGKLGALAHIWATASQVRRSGSTLCLRWCWHASEVDDLFAPAAWHGLLVFHSRLLTCVFHTAQGLIVRWLRLNWLTYAFAAGQRFVILVVNWRFHCFDQDVLRVIICIRGPNSSRFSTKRSCSLFSRAVPPRILSRILRICLAGKIACWIKMTLWIWLMNIQVWIEREVISRYDYGRMSLLLIWCRWHFWLVHYSYSLLCLMTANRHVVGINGDFSC